MNYITVELVVTVCQKDRRSKAGVAKKNIYNKNKHRNVVKK
jgi:hypothetical protein